MAAESRSGHQIKPHLSGLAHTSARRYKPDAYAVHDMVEGEAGGDWEQQPVEVTEQAMGDRTPNPEVTA